MALRPGFNRRKMDFNDKMEAIDIEERSFKAGARSRSIDPL